ncbi:MAG: efflux RND transporter permease subunit [Desulfobacteraceae bacterium]|jgi:predicted RND superfamily exporter protein|nr:efflux RND transporter permease subunit [Desulfobacteraceae bacterium]
MDRYIRFVLKRPVWVLVVFLIVTIMLASGMLKLQFDTSITAFLPTSDIAYKNYEQVKEIYGDCDTFVILDITDKNLWQYETFRRINDLIIDLEEFEDYKPAQEQQRIAQLDRLLADQAVTAEALLNHFIDDPAYKRLLARKLKLIGGDAGLLSSRTKRKLKSAVVTSNELKSVEMIDDIISPLTSKDITGEDDSLETIELIETDSAGNRLLPRTDTEFQIFIEKLRRNPVFEQGIYVADDKGNITDLGIVIRFKDGSNSDPIAREILEIVNSHDKLNIISQGQPLIYIWINNYMQQDLSRLIPLVMLVVVIIFFINFKSIRGVILPFVTLSMASLWILGLMGHLGAKITTVGTSIPVLMIAVGSSYAIHILNQYYADYNLITKEGKTDGLQHAMGHISMTVFLTGLTTFVAFMTLATHEISAISEWGLFSAIGIMFAVLISSSVIPAALILMPHKPGGARFSNRKGVNSPVIDRIIRLMSIGALYHYKKVLAVVLILLVVSFIGLFKIQVDTELLRNFKEDNYIRTSAKTISDKYGGRWGFNIIIDSGKPDGVKCTEYLNTVFDFRAWLEAEENKDLCIGRTDAFPDFLKTMNMAMNNDDTESFCNPACNMDIADYLEIYSDDDDNSDGRIDQFEPYVDTEFQACNVLARLGEDGDTLLGTLGMEHIFKKISEHLDQTLPPGYSYKITGHPSLMVQSAGYIVDGQIKSLMLTLLVIGIMILILLRDFKAGLLSLIPMSVAVIFNFGIMGWFGIYLDVATSTIATITIGIGVDDTIHFLNTFRYYRNLGEDMNTAIQHTLEVAGKAILFTSMALIFGFSVMGLSTFKPLILFGVLMIVTMVATTIGALLVLPCAIKLTNVSLVKKTA